MVAELLYADRVSAARAASEALRERLERLPTVIVGARPPFSSIHLRASGVLRALRALRTTPAFASLLADADEPARDAAAAIDRVRTRSLPGLLEHVGLLVNPAVLVRDRNRAASQFHLPVEELLDDLARLVQTLNDLDLTEAPPGGEAG
jgi:hypothetical protein